MSASVKNTDTATTLPPRAIPIVAPPRPLPAGGTDGLESPRSTHC